MVSRFSFIDGSLFLNFVSVCFFPFQFSLLFVFISHCINDSFYIVLCQACDTLCHNVLKVVEIFIWSEASPCPLIYHWVWGSCENMVFTKMFVYVFFWFFCDWLFIFWYFFFVVDVVPRQDNITSCHNVLNLVKVVLWNEVSPCPLVYRCYCFVFFSFQFSFLFVSISQCIILHSATSSL